MTSREYPFVTTQSDYLLARAFITQLIADLNIPQKRVSPDIESYVTQIVDQIRSEVNSTDSPLEEGVLLVLLNSISGVELAITMEIIRRMIRST